MFEEGKGGGAQRQRIDLLFVSRLVYYNYYCAMLHLINANTIVVMLVEICMCEFIHHHFCSTTGRIRTNATSV
jgi:hypothetical protein